MAGNNTSSFEWSIKRSNVRRTFLLVVHLLAASSIMLSAIATVYKVSLMVSLAFSAGYYGSGRDPSRITGTLRYTEAFGWELLDNIDYRSISILQSTVITPWVIVLHYRRDDKTQYWAIFYDALDTASYRRLVALLRITWSTDS